MILDLHRHLQRQCLWHQAPELIATCLIAYNDLHHYVVCIVYESQRLGNSYLTFVYIKLFIEPFEAVRRWRRKFWCTDAAALSRSDLNCQWKKPIRDGLAVHVQASIDVDVDRQPETLEGAVSRRVKARRNPYALAPGVCRGPVHGTGQAKAPFQNRYSRLALAIALRETLLHHTALLVEHEHARIGHPPMVIAFGNAIGGMVLVDVLVQETKLTDYLAALIREERVGDVLLGSKGGQHVHIIVTDGKRDNVVTLKVRQALLQLNELRFAVWSPPRTAVKDHQGTPTVPSLVQIDVPAMLVWQDDVWEALPNRRAHRGEVNTKIEGSSHKCSSFVVPQPVNWALEVGEYDRRAADGRQLRIVGQHHECDGLLPHQPYCR